MSPTTGNWKDRPWAKRWTERRSQLERRQNQGEWVNCDANCYCCVYLEDAGCDTTDDDANENCLNPQRTPTVPPPAPAPAPTTIAPASESTPPPATTPAPEPTPAPEVTTAAPAPETTPAATSSAETSSLEGSASSSASSTVTAESSDASTNPSESTATAGPSASSSVVAEWVFPAATASIEARQASTADTAGFGPVYREDAMVVQWTPEDSTPGIQWTCESNSGALSGGVVSSDQSQPLRIEFNGMASQSNSSDDIYCRLGFTNAPGQTVQWQYINTPDANGANVITAPADVAQEAVATATATNSDSPDSSGGGGLSTGAAAGIGVGIGLAVIIGIIIGVCFWRRRKNKGARRTPVWGATSNEKTTSDDSSHPSYYSGNLPQGDGVHELAGSPPNPTELPAGLKGTAAMPSELYHPDEKRTMAELGSDKDFEEQQVRPRPLAPNSAQHTGGEAENLINSPTEYGGSENGTFQPSVSPASGTMSTDGFGVVSPMAMRKQRQNSSEQSPTSFYSQETEPGWTADRTQFQRKPIGGA